MKRYLSSGVNMRYAYDGARRRVLKTGTFGTTRFVYDQADHLIYEVKALSWNRLGGATY